MVFCWSRFYDKASVGGRFICTFIIPLLAMWAAWDTARANWDVAKMQHDAARPIFTVEQLPGELDFVTNVLNTDRLLIKNAGEKTREPPKIELRSFWDIVWTDRKYSQHKYTVEIFDYFGVTIRRRALDGILRETMAVNNRSNRFDFAEVLRREVEGYGVQRLDVNLRFMIKIDYLSRLGDLGCEYFQGDDFEVKRIERDAYDKNVFSEEEYCARGYNQFERDRLLRDLKTHIIGTEKVEQGCGVSRVLIGRGLAVGDVS